MSGKFLKGQSGNPTGKPRGAKNRSSLVAERLFADDIKRFADR